MKKTIAVIGSAAALSFAGAGLAAAEDVATDDQAQTPETTEVDTTAGETTEGDDAADATTGDDATEDGATDDVDTPEEVSAIAQQLCGSISAYDFLGSAEGTVPGLSGEECEANADAAVQAAMTGDIAGALDILKGIEAETPDEGDDAEDAGSAGMLGSLTGDNAADDTEGDDTEAGETAPEQPAFGS
ncbi:hypothetical protein NCCP2495_29540 [Dietzia sp. NCCP-2495]|nr:hypothetical protein NCCP2495_29540 [Dietzia sp. NCCP-2495]